MAGPVGCGGGSGGVECPAVVGGVGEAEAGESGEVGGGGEEGEVGGDAEPATRAGAAAAVAAAHQVGEFAFDFGSDGPVVGFPRGSRWRARAAVSLAVPLGGRNGAERAGLPLPGSASCRRAGPTRKRKQPEAPARRACGHLAAAGNAAWSRRTGAVTTVALPVALPATTRNRFAHP